MFTLDVASAFTPWSEYASESGDAKRAVGGPVSAKSSLFCMGLRSAGYRHLVDLQTECDDEHSPTAVGPDGSGAEPMLPRKLNPVLLMPSPLDVDQALKARPVHSLACREHAAVIIHNKRCLRPITAGNDDPELMAEVDPSSINGDDGPSQSPREEPVVIIHAKRCVRPIAPELAPADDSALDDLTDFESPWSAPLVIHAKRCMRPVTPELGPTDVLTDELDTLELRGDAGKVHGNFQCADAGEVHETLTVTAIHRAAIVKTGAGATEQASFGMLQMTRMMSDEAGFTPVAGNSLLTDEHAAGQCPRDDIERQSVCSRAHRVPALALPTDCFNLISAEEAQELHSSMEPSSRYPQWQELPGDGRTPEKWANIAGNAASTEQRVVAVTEMTPEQVTSAGTNWIKALCF